MVARAGLDGVEVERDCILERLIAQFDDFFSGQVEDLGSSREPVVGKLIGVGRMNGFG